MDLTEEQHQEFVYWGVAGALAFSIIGGVLSLTGLVGNTYLDLSRRLLLAGFVSFLVVVFTAWVIEWYPTERQQLIIYIVMIVIGSLILLGEIAMWAGLIGGTP